MKKKIMTVMAICAVSLAATACGSNTQETTAAETTTTETTTEMAADESTDAEEASAEGEETSGAEGEESEAAETTKADLSNVDPQEALGPGAFDENESVALEENQNFSDLENSDYKGFAGQVVQAVTAKDMNALADLMHYPVYISFVKDNDGVVSDKDSFLALDPEMVFGGFGAVHGRCCDWRRYAQCDHQFDGRNPGNRWYELLIGHWMKQRGEWDSRKAKRIIDQKRV